MSIFDAEARLAVDGALLERIQAMPKIELHRHLEGSLRLQTLVDIAREYDIEMPEYDPELLRPFVQMMPGETRSMAHFLGKFATLRQFYRSLDVIERITREIVLDAASDNVRYMELRFTPPALSNIIGCSLSEIVSLVCQTASKTAEDAGIDVRLIVSMNRHESVETGEAVLKAALAHQDKGVVGLDIAGFEVGHPVQAFRHIFSAAKEAGLGITVHAGEWDGSASVWDAVSILHANRIGHGIHTLDDPGVLNVVIHRGITLEVCPSSNYDSGAIDRYEDHPLPILTKQGVRVTINTDDPLVSNITLSDEYARVLTYLPFTFDDLKSFILNAARAAFLPVEERMDLVRRFEDWLAEFEIA